MAGTATAAGQAHEPGPSSWSQATELAAVNGESMDGCPFPSRDGRRLYIASDRRPGGYGGIDIWVAERQSEHDPWGAPVNLGPQINTPDNLGCTINSAAEEAGPIRVRHELFVSSNRGGNSDIYASPAYGPFIGPPAPVTE